MRVLALQTRELGTLVISQAVFVTLVSLYRLGFFTSSCRLTKASIRITPGVPAKPSCNALLKALVMARMSGWVLGLLAADGVRLTSGRLLTATYLAPMPTMLFLM